MATTKSATPTVRQLCRRVGYEAAAERSETKRPTAIPLVPRCGIYLAACGHSDDERFRSIFILTWKAIGVRDQCRLLTHWRNNAPLHVSTISPKIELFEHWPLVRHAQQDTVGLCDLWGSRLRFNARMVRRMPDEIASELIAHELAHALQYACLPPPHSRSSTCIQDWEEKARAIERSWGFDPVAASAWYFSNERALIGDMEPALNLPGRVASDRPAPHPVKIRAIADDLSRPAACARSLKGVRPTTRPASLIPNARVDRTAQRAEIRDGAAFAERFRRSQHGER